MINQETNQSFKTESRFFYGYIVVATATLVLFVAGAAYFAFGVFFKPVLNEFGWTRAATSGAFSLSWVSQALLLVVMGKLTDRFGTRVVVTMCGLIVGSGFLLNLLSY